MGTLAILYDFLIKRCRILEEKDVWLEREITILMLFFRTIRTEYLLNSYITGADVVALFCWQMFVNDVLSVF